MGHEAAGVISAIGAAVTGWEVGDRVTFDSTIYPLDDWYTRKDITTSATTEKFWVSPLGTTGKRAHLPSL